MADVFVNISLILYDFEQVTVADRWFYWKVEDSHLSVSQALDLVAALIINRAFIIIFKRQRDGFSMLSIDWNTADTIYKCTI